MASKPRKRTCLATCERAAAPSVISTTHGCDDCSGTGYRGRVGLFEIMEMNDELTRLFLREAPAEQLRRRRAGHRARLSAAIPVR